ncbi:MAG: radical SAM protein [Candidatus Omnitrophica bacterium]|nr:radical SAM protein [Candidatus Omnitrophota bacterium]
MLNPIVKSTQKADIFFNILGARIFNNFRPIFVNWPLTYKCNYRCPYCKIYENQRSELSCDDIKLRIAKLVKLGLKWIIFTGGEPFLRNDLPEIIAAAKKHNLFVCVNSNGSFSPEMLGKCGNIDLLNLSLDGLEEIHDKIRGRGAFNHMLSALESAKLLKIKVKITTTIHRINMNKIESILSFCIKNNIMLSFQMLNRNCLGSKEVNNLSLSNAEYKQAIKNIILLKKSKKYSKAISHSLSSLKFLAQRADLSKLQCASGKIAFRVTPEGKMYACNHHSFLNDKESNGVIDLKEDLKSIRLKIKQLSKLDLSNCHCSCMNRIRLNLLWNYGFGF